MTMDFFSSSKKFFGIFSVSSEGENRRFSRVRFAVRRLGQLYGGLY